MKTAPLFAWQCPECGKRATVECIWPDTSPPPDPAPVRMYAEPAQELLVPGAIYEHYKGGQYKLEGFARNSTNASQKEAMVIYRSLKFDEFRIREMREFCEYVKWPNDTFQPRFRRVREKDDARR